MSYISAQARTGHGTKVSLIDFQAVYNSDSLVLGLIIAHATYALVLFAAIISLVIFILGPVSLLGMGADDSSNAPLGIFVPSLLFTLFYIIACFVAIFSLKYRNVAILRTQMATNVILGTSVFICGIVLYLFFNYSVLQSQYDTWIQGYSEWFSEVSSIDEQRWRDMQDRLNCCGSDVSTLLTENGLSILSGTECEGIKENVEFTGLVTDFVENGNDNVDEFLEELEELDLGVDFEFCVESVSKFFDNISSYIIVFAVITFVFTLFSSYFLTRLVRNLILIGYYEAQEQEEEQKPAKLKKELAPELLDIYCESFRMSTWKNSLKSSADVISEYANSFVKVEEKEASRHLETVSIHEDRNQPQRVSLPSPTLVRPSRRRLRKQKPKFSSIKEVDVGVTKQITL